MNRLLTNVFAGDHKGYTMYFSTNSYNCPALNLYGYVNDLALIRAIDRKLNQKRFTILVEVDGTIVDHRTYNATTSHHALNKAVRAARRRFPNANSWEARIETTLNK